MSLVPYYEEEPPATEAASQPLHPVPPGTPIPPDPWAADARPDPNGEPW